MEYLEAKQIIFIFFPFKKGLHNGHTVRIKLIFEKINYRDFLLKGVEVAGGQEQVESLAEQVLSGSQHSVHWLLAVTPQHFQPLMSKT